MTDYTLRVMESTTHDIAEALDEAQSKHGPLTTDPVRACAILLREGGEAMNEALLWTSPRKPIEFIAHEGWATEKKKRMYEELAQVAATAMLIMAQIKEGSK